MFIWASQKLLIMFVFILLRPSTITSPIPSVTVELWPLNYRKKCHVSLVCSQSGSVHHMNLKHIHFCWYFIRGWIELNDLHTCFKWQFDAITIGWEYFVIVRTFVVLSFRLTKYLEFCCLISFTVNQETYPNSIFHNDIILWKHTSHQLREIKYIQQFFSIRIESK